MPLCDQDASEDNFASYFMGADFNCLELDLTIAE
jgi:hypothetical protein